jgi:hypothetical protein
VMQDTRGHSQKGHIVQVGYSAWSQENPEIRLLVWTMDLYVMSVMS